MPIEFYTRWDLNPQTSRIIPRQKKNRSFEKTAMSFFNWKRTNSKFESILYDRQTERTVTASMLVSFNRIARPSLRHWAAFTTFIFFKKFNRVSKKKLFDVVVKRGNSVKWYEAIYEKSLHCHWKVQVWTFETV